MSNLTRALVATFGSFAANLAVIAPLAEDLTISLPLAALWTVMTYAAVRVLMDQRDRRTETRSTKH